MKTFLMKILLILFIVYLGLSNYKLVVGTKTAFGDEQINDVKVISELLDIENIYYYTFGDGYLLVTETKNNLYVNKVTESDISILTITGFFINNIKPQKINPIPWWVFGIGIIIIIFFPTKNKYKG